MLQNKFKKVPLLVISYLTKFDNIIQIGFWVIPKIRSANSFKPTHDIINYYSFIFPFESEKYGKEKEKKLQNLEYLENEKTFLDSIKKHFLYFLKGCHLIKKQKFDKK